MADLGAITACIREDRLIATLSDIVDIASPTGEEAPLAEHIASLLVGYGIEATTHALNEGQANVLAIMRGHAGSEPKNLLLYSPLDTVTTGDKREDLPWIGPELRPDMQAKAQLLNGHVVGLGAHNPKGHAACIIEAACVLKELNARLNGDVYFGFGSGGMPTQTRQQWNDRPGHGVGCEHLLSCLPDLQAAIIAKSGFAVTWEEVGFLWMDVVVEGVHTYVGSVHLLPYQGAISNAGKLIVRLEEYFLQRSQDLATDCVKPQAVVSFIESGWERMPAFTPAQCRFRIDIRFGPDQTSDEVETDFREVLAELCDELNIVAEPYRVQDIPASRTDFDSEVIQTTIAAWEAVKGREHVPFREMSGSTDANVIRAHGIPTARMGLPKAELPDIDFQMGMNSAAVSDLCDLTAMLVMSSLSICGESVRG